MAEEFRRVMANKGVEVNVHHIREANAKEPPPADLYIFGSPGRIGKPISSMRRFLKRIRLPSGTRYAIFSTEGAPRPDKRTGKMPTEEEIARWQHVLPIMDEISSRQGPGQGGEYEGPRAEHQRSLGGRLGEERSKTSW